METFRVESIIPDERKENTCMLRELANSGRSCLRYYYYYYHYYCYSYCYYFLPPGEGIPKAPASPSSAEMFRKLGRGGGSCGTRTIYDSLPRQRMRGDELKRSLKFWRTSAKKKKKGGGDENSTDVRVFVARAAAPERAEEEESRELSAEARWGRETRGARARQPQASPRLNAQTPPGDLLKTQIPILWSRVGNL